MKMDTADKALVISIFALGDCSYTTIVFLKSRGEGGGGGEIGEFVHTLIRLSLYVRNV